MKVFLATRASGDRPVEAVPNQEFYSVEWQGEEDEVKALLEFAEKAHAFSRWCREAKQLKQTAGKDKPLPDFIKPPKRTTRAQTKRSTKQDAEGSEE